MDTKSLITNSVDARAYRFNIKLHLLVYCALAVFGSLMCVVAFWDMPCEMKKELIWFNTFFAIGYLPMTVYYGIKLYVLIKKHEILIFSEAYLGKFKSSGARGNVAFLVQVTDETGRSVIRETRSLYSTRGSIANIDAWQNKKATVAYDPQKEIVIICALCG